MKLSKFVIGTTAAISVASVIGLAYAQTYNSGSSPSTNNAAGTSTTPDRTMPSNQGVLIPKGSDSRMDNSSSTGTPSNSTDTMSNGSQAPMSSDTATGPSNNRTRMGERMARTDRN